MAGPSRSPMLSHFIDMGFPEDTVLKAIEENGQSSFLGYTHDVSN